jgi:hypothetical protein
MTALPAGPLLFDTGIYIRFSRGENYLWLGEDARVQRTILTRRKPDESSLSLLRFCVCWGLLLTGVVPYSADSEFGFNVYVRHSCQLLRKLDALLCLESGR